MRILVTGAAGMIGSRLVQELLDQGYCVIGVDRKSGEIRNQRYVNRTLDLSNFDLVKRVMEETKPDRIIHLAGLAHSQNGGGFTWEDYRRINVDCSQNVFQAAGARPVLFISTVDVYGFTDGTAVRSDSPICPCSDYAKSKAIAEDLCKKLPSYSIYRFSPVYSEIEKRDIQKRYYLKYPRLAYLIGKGTEYEVLNIDRAVASMTAWCASQPQNDIRIIKDNALLRTSDCIKNEKQEGRASVVLHLPNWSAQAMYRLLKGITGRNKYTYLLNKAVHPLRTE